MVKALEDTTEAVARRQLQDMLNNAITEPDKFHNLGLRIKSSNVGKNTGLPKTTYNFLPPPPPPPQWLGARSKRLVFRVFTNVILTHTQRKFK